MGLLKFPGAHVYHEGLQAAKRALRESLEFAAAHAAGASEFAGSEVELTPTLESQEDDGWFGSGGAGLDGEENDDDDDDDDDGGEWAACELWHIFNEPMFGRHLWWDDRSCGLPRTEVLQTGYYGAPVLREGRPEAVAVCFGDVDDAHALQAQHPQAFSAACLQVWCGAFCLFVCVCVLF
jgi:hypothetical protein